MILVIAPNYREAVDWAAENKLRPSEFRFVHNLHQLQGHRGAKLKVLRSLGLSGEQLLLLVQARAYLGDGCRL
jgi:hypothetical protein